jgi:hypothetical protein
MLALVVGVALAGSHRSDPVAVAPAPATVQVATAPGPVAPLPPVRRGPVILAGEYEHGTDGLMGRLPFGLAADTPTVYAERRDKFIIDDTIVARSGPALHMGRYPR